MDPDLAEKIRFKLRSKDDDDKDKDKDKGPLILAGFNSAPKEPPASSCNDVIATTGKDFNIVKIN